MCAKCTGDILSLVEKAEQNVSSTDTERLAKRMMENKFDFNDFMDQSRMMTQMGSVGNMMKMIPGALPSLSCSVIATGYVPWAH